jgi:hypothetical protein
MVTPVTTFRLDDRTKAALNMLADRQNTTMTDVIKGLVEAAANGLVPITNIDTRPQYDHHVNLPGHSTNTVFVLHPDQRYGYIDQEQKTNSTTMDRYHGRTLTTGMHGHPDEDELREYLEQGRGQELMQTVCDGHSVEWDGNNMTGHMTEDAIDAWHELSETLGNTYWDQKYTFWDADDWFQDVDEITAETTDEELMALADEFESVAAADNVVTDETALDWLTDRREELREEASYEG